MQYNKAKKLKHVVNQEGFLGKSNNTLKALMSSLPEKHRKAAD